MPAFEGFELLTAVAGVRCDVPDSAVVMLEVVPADKAFHPALGGAAGTKRYLWISWRVLRRRPRRISLSSLASESAHSRHRELKSVPFVPRSHAFIEPLIGTLRREYLDQTFF
jgi:hypothetical protein